MSDSINSQDDSALAGTVPAGVHDAADQPSRDAHELTRVDSSDALDHVPDESYEQVLEVGWTKPLDVPVTGSPAVDEAMAVLDGIAEVDLHEHPRILQEVHDRLRAVLVDGASA
jgi:hypothetical protein